MCSYPIYYRRVGVNQGCKSRGWQKPSHVWAFRENGGWGALRLSRQVSAPLDDKICWGHTGPLMSPKNRLRVAAPQTVIPRPRAKHTRGASRPPSQQRPSSPSRPPHPRPSVRCVLRSRSQRPQIRRARWSRSSPSCWQLKSSLPSRASGRSTTAYSRAATPSSSLSSARSGQCSPARLTTPHTTNRITNLATSSSQTPRRRPPPPPSCGLYKQFAAEKGLWSYHPLKTQATTSPGWTADPLSPARFGRNLACSSSNVPNLRVASTALRRRWTGARRLPGMAGIDPCITQLKAQGPSRTCNESKEEEEDGGHRVFRKSPHVSRPSSLAAM